MIKCGLTSILVTSVYPFFMRQIEEIIQASMWSNFQQEMNEYQFSGVLWVTNTEYWAAYSRSPTGGWAPCTFTVMQHFQPFARQIIDLKLILYSWLFWSVYIQVIPPKSFLLSRVKQWSAEHWPKYCSGFCWVSRASKQLVGTNSCATSARRHFLDNFFIPKIEKSYLK